MRPQLLLATLALLLVPALAQATPVQLVLNSGTEGGFQFSVLTSGSSSCEFISVGGSPVEFCKTGNPTRDLSGTLSADLTAGVLSNIMGTIFVAGDTDIIVTDGTVDFGASGPDEFGAELITSTHGTFYFLDHTFAGTANSFDGVVGRLWGNNWDTGSRPSSGSYGIDLGFEVVPEPGTGLLAGLGLAWLAGTKRRRRAS